MKKIFLVLSLVVAVCAQAQISITCADARTAALSVSANDEQYNDGATYVVRGYVTAIQTAWSSSWKNVSFWMADTQDGGKVIQAYRCVANTQVEAPNVGALVEVTGKLTKFNSTPEIAAGCTCEILTTAEAPKNLGAKTIAEFLSLQNTKDTCILTGIVANIVMDSNDDTQYNQYGNFDLVEIGDESVYVYIYGLWTATLQSKQFRTMNIDAGDTLTIKAIYAEHGGTPQVANAIYVSHSKYVEPSTQEEVVDFATAFADGWDKWIGKTVTFTNDFYYCDTWNNTIACRRLRAPEEYGEEGTAEYAAAAARNTNDSCHLLSPTISWQTYRLGSIIRGLKAYVPAANQLQAVNSPELINNAFPTTRPDLGDATLVICAANIENFYVDNVGTSGASDAEQLKTQKTKIGAALNNMNADIYALCEVEQGTSALLALIEELGGTSEWGYVAANTSSYNSTMAGFIYRKSKVSPYASVQIPYSTYGISFKYREAVQEFKEISSGEMFYLSMNHFYAKITKTDADREQNMTDLLSKLNYVTSYDPDILVVGDLNAYSKEEAVLKLTRDNNYVDLLQKYDPEGYSHLFDCTVGFLDHAYCTSSMEPQVTKAVSYHLNADTPKNIYAYTAGDESMYRYSDHDPILVGLKLGKNTAEGIEDLQTDQRARKTLENGQLILTLPDGTKYNVIGLQIR